MPDLPLVTRWTAVAKRNLVAMVARGDVSLDEACRHYRISVEEFAQWREDYPAKQEERA